jgi:hypothetical protein
LYADGDYIPTQKEIESLEKWESVKFVLHKDEFIPIKKSQMHLKVEDFKYLIRINGL